MLGNLLLTSMFRSFFDFGTLTFSIEWSTEIHDNWSLIFHYWVSWSFEYWNLFISVVHNSIVFYLFERASNSEELCLYMLGNYCHGFLLSAANCFVSTIKYKTRNDVLIQYYTWITSETTWRVRIDTFFASFFSHEIITIMSYDMPYKYIFFYIDK